MNQKKIISIFLIFIFLLIFLSVISLSTGNVNISFSKIMSVFFKNGGTIQEINIITKIRLPRLLMAGILGGALALSGFLLQTYFQNPIAGPFVLGISSGAKMTVAATMIFLLKNGIPANSLTLVASAFLGALLSTFFILLVARKINHIGSLLVAGIMIGYITSAITDFFITFAQDADIVNLHNWSRGSFSGFDVNDCLVSGIIVFLTLIIVFLLAKPIGAYQLGEIYARSVGVNTKIFRPVLIFISSILSATVTSFAGPVSFVGIAVPFLVKQIFQTSKPLIIIPASFLGGSIFCILCDLIARSMFSPLEMNISTVTSFFGSPIVIFIILKKHKTSY